MIQMKIEKKKLEDKERRKSVNWSAITGNGDHSKNGKSSVEEETKGELSQILDSIESNMNLAENDDGFASCEEDDGVDKSTGDPIHDYYLQIKKVQSKEDKSNICVT